MFKVYETVDGKGRRNVFFAPDNWEREGILYWPGISKKINTLRKSRCPPDIDNWEFYESFKVLASLPTFKDALAKEKMLEMFSDSESAQEAEKKKLLKRRHPVNYNSNLSNLFELNTEFEGITEKRKEIPPKSNQIKKQKASATITSGQYLNSQQNSLPVVNSYSCLGSESIIVHSIEVVNKAPSLVSDLSTPLYQDSNDCGTKGIALGELDNGNMQFLINPFTGDLEFDSNQNIDVSNVSNQLLSLNQNNEVYSSSEMRNGSTDMLQIISFDQKLDCLGKTVNSIEAKQDMLELKLKDFEQKQDSLLKLLAAAHVKLDLLANNSNSRTVSNEILNVELPVALPVENDEDFLKLMLVMKNNIYVAEALENQVKVFGGKDSRKCFYEIIKHIATDDVLMNYSWKGTTEGKKPFKTLKTLCNFLKKCVRIHYADYSDNEFKQDVQEYLKHAPTRVSRRYL